MPGPGDYVIGLGANLGSRRANLCAAVERLAGHARIARVSALYESEPFGPPQPSYLNAAVRVESELPPQALLDRALAIEAELGRVRDPALRYGPRTIDLDLLWAGEPHDSAQLTVPHPRLCERWFALAPLLDVAPELEPIYGPALAALGGRRSPRAERLAIDPCAEIARDPGELRVRASAPELADALADAVSALAREFSAPATFPAAATAASERVEARAGAHPQGLLFAWAAQAVSAIARGCAATRAIVVHLDDERCEGRLLGVAGRPMDGPVPRLVELTHALGAAGFAVELRVSC